MAIDQMTTKNKQQQPEAITKRKGYLWSPLLLADLKQIPQAPEAAYADILANGCYDPETAGDLQVSPETHAAIMSVRDRIREAKAQAYSDYINQLPDESAIKRRLSR